MMDEIGGEYLPVRKGVITGQADNDAKVPYIACRDIGRLAAMAFAAPDRFLGRRINLIGDFVSGDELAEMLTRVTGRAAMLEGIEESRRLLPDILTFEDYLRSIGSATDHPSEATRPALRRSRLWTGSGPMSAIALGLRSGDVRSRRETHPGKEHGYAATDAPPPVGRGDRLPRSRSRCRPDRRPLRARSPTPVRDARLNQAA